MLDQILLIKSFSALFAIMNPFLTLPFLLAMTSGFTVAERRILALKVTLYILVIGAVVFLAGQKVLDFFGVSIDVFRIAGGALLSGIAWSMVNGQKAESRQGSAREQSHMAMLDNIAFYPMAFPMTVGPGTIATIIIYSAQAKDVRSFTTVGIVLLAVILISFVVMMCASLFGRVLSETMQNIIARVMGMILLAIALDMVIVGLKAVFPPLA